LGSRIEVEETVGARRSAWLPVPFASLSGAGRDRRSASGVSVEQLAATLATVHKFWAYVVLIAAVVGLVASAGAWFGMVRLKPRLAGTIYIVPLDIQVLIGIVILLGGRGVTLVGSQLYEHPTTMVLAAIVAHIGQVMARRADNEKRAAGITAVAIGVSLVLVVVGVVRVMQGR
jgi:hypothetical protein